MSAISVERNPTDHLGSRHWNRATDLVHFVQVGLGHSASEVFLVKVLGVLQSVALLAFVGPAGRLTPENLIGPPAASLRLDVDCLLEGGQRLEPGDVDRVRCHDMRGLDPPGEREGRCEGGYRVISQKAMLAVCEQ